MSPNAPPLTFGLGADPDAFPPFNLYPTYLNGDSGSPWMLPATDDVLVFLRGDDTAPPCSQMQADMDTLSEYLDCYPHQMNPHQVQ